MVDLGLARLELVGDQRETLSPAPLLRTRFVKCASTLNMPVLTFAQQSQVIPLPLDLRIVPAQLLAQSLLHISPLPLPHPPL